MITIHMAASLDGFIARHDGRTDWMETSDTFDAGATLAPEAIQAFLGSIDCYVMGARTYETALDFEGRGHGWAYGDKPVVVLTHRTLSKNRGTVEFRAGDLKQLMEELNSRFRNIWIAGGARIATECLRLGLADEIRYSIIPAVIGEGISFFEGLKSDVPLHLVESTAYRNGIVALRYEVSGGRKQRM